MLCGCVGVCGVGVLFEYVCDVCVIVLVLFLLVVSFFFFLSFFFFFFWFFVLFCFFIKKISSVECCVGLLSIFMQT